MATALSEYEYSAFISYAFDDDKAWEGWISTFGAKLDEMLAPRLGRVGVKKLPAFRPANGLPQGLLSEELRSAVRKSFAMMVFVHNNYVTSDWCLKELEYFREAFGQEGFHTRLYIIAMSEPDMRLLRQTEAWRTLFPEDQISKDFFQKTPQNDRPIDIYIQTALNQGAVMNADFKNRFFDIREHLANAVRQCVYAERLPSSPPLTRQSSRHTGESVVFVEGSATSDERWIHLTQTLLSTWNGAASNAGVRLCPEELLPKEFSSACMDRANGVIVQWSKKALDSLEAQISLLDQRLPGRPPAPGLVVYPAKSSDDKPEVMAVRHWPVVRFVTAHDTSAMVVHPDDAGTLGCFLRSVLEHQQA